MVGAFVSLVWVGFLVVVSLCVNSVVNLRFFRCFIAGLVCVHVCGVCGGFPCCCLWCCFWWCVAHGLLLASRFVCLRL